MPKKSFTSSVEFSDQLFELLAAVGLGDQQAFAELYDVTSAHLYGVLLRILKEPAMANDCLQDAYVQIWQKAQHYRPDKAKPMTWMMAIARYRAIDLIRRQKTRRDALPELMVLDEQVRAVEQFEPNLASCLHELPDETRHVILAAYIEGYTHSELQGQLDVPLGTLKSWIRRGMQQLQSCLGVNDDELLASSIDATIRTNKE